LGASAALLWLVWQLAGGEAVLATLAGAGIGARGAHQTRRGASGGEADAAGATAAARRSQS
jgi:hypothetical protein